MNTLVRLHNLTPRLRPSTEDLFASFFGPATAGEPGIKIDVSEDDKAYRVTAVLAGVRREDIHVNVDKNEFSIEAEIKRETSTNDGERVVHSERFYGKTSRSFVVAQEIDDSTVEAKYVDGVLNLVLPKKSQPTAKRIAIN
jgi:HSP20 family protein